MKAAGRPALGGDAAGPRRPGRLRLRLFLLLLWLAAMAGLAGAGPASAAIPAPPGGPVLVITGSTPGYGAFYAEILRNEGFNLFAVADIATVTAATLAAYDVVVLAPTALPAARVTDLQNWVSGGGNLIAMAPDAQLAPLLGLTPLNTRLTDAWLRIDTSTRPGSGLTGLTLQFHGPADRYTLAGALSLATLHTNATTADGAPAVTLRSVGSGRAAAFTYDLARSVVLTRQGNPAWAAQERDGLAPVRSDDKFYGNAAADPQKDWVDPSRVAVPQADEQQRLFANLILLMNESRRPLPRFWYLPFANKAVVVLTGDDHGNNGSAGRFDQHIAASPQGCSLARWECVRSTSYAYDNTPIGDAAAAQYSALGFEFGVHINTGCADYTAASLESAYTAQIASWRAAFPSLPAPITQRHHCIVWSDWATGAQTQLAHQMRLDTSYYYWPPTWINNVPGLFTGSAMPMRFAALDGTPIDVYQATTQMTDESGQTYPYNVDTLLDAALGTTGYYGVYTVNAHTDTAVSDVSTAVVASAKARAVPIVSSAQMLRWLDARNGASFGALSWNGSTSLAFSVVAGADAVGLQAMLPAHWGTRAFTGVTRAGSAVPSSIKSVKGVDYAVFAADPGAYTASYAADTTAPSVVSSSTANGATEVPAGSPLTLTFSEPMDPSTLNTSTFVLRDPNGVRVSASVVYDAARRTATLTPAQPLAAATVYTAALLGGTGSPAARDLAGNAVASLGFSFTTAGTPAPPPCPCSAWAPSAAPATASYPDSSGVELGVRFSVDTAGYATGVRFYKGTGNTGVHVGSVWTGAGQRLANATFSGETATGWQQASFASPVALAANAVYVVSYFAPNGGYAADSGFFGAAGVDRSPVHLLSDAAAGGNGLYAYGSVSSFPASSYQATNYWVDIVFTTTVAADTTPPTVAAVAPAAGATAVPVASRVTATFSEAIDTATLSASTFFLQSAAGTPVAATLSHDPASRTATLAPTALLAGSTGYTATLRGGASGPVLKDTAGNALAATRTWSFTTAAASAACASPANAIVRENCLGGAPASEWDVSGVGDASIQGFATDISVNRGASISFKVDSGSITAYRLDIYRMGFYGGAGARKVASLLPSATLPQAQPACLNDGATGLVDCGNWAVSATWAVPTDAVSGIYFARLVRADTGGASHVVFVVRDDGGTAALLFQTSDTTWQAYNDRGGASLYSGGPGTNPNRAYKVSYNRPFATRGVDGGQDWVFNAEYPMVRWLEANGYPVAYASGVDADRSGARLLDHTAYLSVGHDEYWSAGQRANVEAARNAGVHLGFFSGNEIFWKTRWEPSIDGSGTAYRTLVTYKETHANAKIDPSSAWTGSWRDPRFSPPADGGRPENALSGTLFMVNEGATTAITVPAADGKMRFWRNTSVAALGAGAVATLTAASLGYEWDVQPDNAVRPAGSIGLSTTTVTNAPVLQNQGSTYAAGTAVHRLSLYRHASGARVFGAGTVQWTWGLDATHDRAGSPADARMQQATVNLLADMNAQPATLQPGLVAASASTDATAPVSTIASPAAGATLPVGTPVTVGGTATDSGGVVGAVDVSVDGGATWHPATGRANWTYDWTPTAAGPATVKSRAADDSGNLETPAAGTAVTVRAPDTTAPTIAGRTPAAGATFVATTTAVNVRFSEAMAPGSIGTATVQLLRPGGAVVAASVVYNAGDFSATLTPTATLSALTLYTVRVVGGSAGVADSAGNRLAATQSWTFRTR